MIKPTLNIKITNIETGKEIFNENTNCIIGGCSDCNGNSVAIMNLIGTPSAVISALAANKTARKQAEKNYPIAALLYKALEPLTELLADD